MTTGFVIKNSGGDYLTDDRHWQSLDDPKNAFVHTEDRISGLRQNASRWRHPPATLTPSVSTPETGTRFTGNPIPF
jgi:hypothetical protein